MTQKSKLLGDLFPHLGLVESYDQFKNVEIRRLAPVEDAGAGDLIFISQDSFFRDIHSVSPAAVIVSATLAEKIPKDLSFPILLSQNAMLAFAKVSTVFCTDLQLATEIHPTAIIHKTAKIAAGVAIGAYAIVEAEAEVGARTQIHSHVLVGPRAKLGEDCVLFSGAKIYQDTIIGSRVRIHANSVIGADGFGYVQEKQNDRVKHVKIHHTSRVRIGDDVEIGALTSIDRGTVSETVIERGCIIDNQVQIGHNCTIEEGAIICGCAGLAGSVRVGKYALIAGQTGIANKIEIGTGARVAGFSGVTKNVPAGEDWGGFPARPMREFYKLQILIGRLPELFEERRQARKGDKKV